MKSPAIFQMSGVTIYDPYSVADPGQPASPTNPRGAFQNNTIPSTKIQFGRQQFLQNVPQPNWTWA